MRQSIKHKQFFELCEWLRKGNSTNGVKYLSDLAVKAGKELGYPISVGATREALEATGTPFEVVRKATAHLNANGVNSGLQAKKLYALADFVVKLAKDLNVDVPENIGKIAERHTK